MTLLYLARHGETAWNAAGRWQGQHDEPLSDLGIAQAAALAARLGHEQIASLYASDLRRAWDTATAIGASTGLAPLPDKRLREVDVGEWRGLTPDETKARYPEGFARWASGGTGWREGETYVAMRARAVEAVSEIIHKHRPDERICIVSHGGVIRALILHTLELADNHRRALGTGPTATLSLIDVSADGGWRVLSYNDAGHLPR